MTNIKEATHLANMDYGEGNTEMWLEVVKTINKKGEEEIIFCRDDNHVHAWHCNYLPIDDYRIIEIKAL